MNNKGFTLIELVATIALLAIVSVVSYVSINNVIEESKISECEQLVMTIKSAVKEYVSDNRYSNKMKIGNDEVEGRYASIDVSTLIGENYLTSPIINPFDKSINLDDSYIRITVKLNPDNTILNSNKDNEGIIILNKDGKDVSCKNKEW